VSTLLTYTLRIADDSLILSQRLSELCGHGPAIEEDIALTNIALDLIGQANSLLEYAAQVQDEGKSADDLAFLRLERYYLNTLLVEQPNGNFADTIVRQWLFDSFRIPFYEALQHSKDMQLAAIAEKALKETRYHWKHASEWVIRLGDGTEESHYKAQEALNQLYRYTDELFFMDEVDSEMINAGIGIDLESLRPAYMERLKMVLEASTLSLPTNNWKMAGGRLGRHSEHMGHLLSEMQYMQRAYPGMEW
jgi:ring-1,2-phenylacetyl-CoA epoxidase subunit PaaC